MIPGFIIRNIQDENPKTRYSRGGFPISFGKTPKIWSRRCDLNSHIAHCLRNSYNCASSYKDLEAYAKNYEVIDCAADESYSVGSVMLTQHIRLSNDDAHYRHNCQALATIMGFPLPEEPKKDDIEKLRGLIVEKTVEFKKLQKQLKDIRSKLGDLHDDWFIMTGEKLYPPR